MTIELMTGPGPESFERQIAGLRTLAHDRRVDDRVITEAFLNLPISTDEELVQAYGEIASQRPDVAKEVEEVYDRIYQMSAACLDADPSGDIFFDNSRRSNRAAKAICSRCVVRGECLEFAMKYDEKFGIWGGLTPLERRIIKARNKLNNLFKS